jgi:hypothetical protein
MTRPTFYVNRLTYRGRPGWHVGSRGSHGYPISIWTGTRDSAETIQGAYNAERDGHIDREERDWLVDDAMTMDTDPLEATA